MAEKSKQEPQFVHELIERVGAAVGTRANAGAVFGEPVERNGLTVIPVARARFGFGGGGGAEGADEGSASGGGGGGGGGVVSPIGYIELHDDSATFKRISTVTDLLAVVATASVAALTLKRLLG
jgi:uncharacterized spore protein YtfJ